MTSGWFDSTIAWISAHPVAAGGLIFLIAFCDAIIVLGIVVPALPLLFAIGALIGLYDGLVGPGTGTFLQLLFVSVIGMEALMGSGAARLVNLGSNVAALLNLALSGHVLYALAIPAAAFGMAGNYLGSTLAITRGSRVIRGILILVLTLLMGKLLMDVLGIRF